MEINSKQWFNIRRSNRTLCPIKAWGSLVHTVLSYEGTNEDTPVNFYQSDTVSNGYIQASEVILHLWATCRTLNEGKIGFQLSQIGTYSMRTSFAMQLHLAGVRDFTIMMMGRWKSLAFLQYARPQIQEFSKNLSELMSSGALMHFSVNHTRQNLVHSQRANHRSV